MLDHSESESLTEGWRGQEIYLCVLKTIMCMSEKDNLCRQICCSLLPGSPPLHLFYSLCVALGGSG